MSLGSNAHESLARFFVDNVVGLACHDTGNVRAVRGIGRIYVRVIVCVVVCIRHFCVVIYVVGGGLSVESRACSHLLSNVFFAPCGIFRHVGKRFVRIVKSRVENGNRHSFALVGKVGRVVNARGVHVCVVAHGNGRDGIGFRIIHALDAVKLFDRIEGVCVHFQSNAVVESGIGIFVLVVQALAVKRRKEVAM